MEWEKYWIGMIYWIYTYMGNPVFDLLPMAMSQNLIFFHPVYLYVWMYVWKYVYMYATPNHN